MVAITNSTAGGSVQPHLHFGASVLTLLPLSVPSSMVRNAPPHQLAAQPQLCPRVAGLGTDDAPLEGGTGALSGVPFSPPYLRRRLSSNGWWQRRRPGGWGSNSPST